MIFNDQVEVNAFLDHSGDESLLEIDGVLGSGIVNYHTGESRSIDVKFMNYMDRALLIDEFGGIKDAHTLEDIQKSVVKVNNKKTLSVAFDNGNGNKVYKRVIHLVAMAFFGDECPARIKTKVDDYRLCMLSNIKLSDFVLRKRSKKPYEDESTKIMAFESRIEFEHFCKFNMIRTKSDFMLFASLNEEQYDIANPNQFEIGVDPETDLDWIEFDYYGSLMRVNKIGKIMRKSGNSWVPVIHRTMKGLKVIDVYCHDGNNRMVNVANIMAKVICGLESRRVIKYIDGNSSNLHIDNLWWKGCGRPFSF